MTMPSKTLLSALALAVSLAPTIALAQHACESTQAISCPEGHRYDSTTRTCTPAPTS